MILHDEKYRKQVIENTLHVESDNYETITSILLKDLDSNSCKMFQPTDSSVVSSGYWKKEYKKVNNDAQNFTYIWITCSECGEPPQKSWELTHYCPFCGVKMDMKKSQEDKR